MTSRGAVLCVTSSFPRWSGDDTTPFVLHLAQDLQELGWSVEVLAPHAPGAAQSETLDGVPVERFRYWWPEAQQTVCYAGGALINLRRRPANWLKLPTLVAAELAALSRRLGSRRPTLVHSHWILPQGFTASLAAARHGVPHVTTAHGSDVFDLQGGLLRRAKRFALGRADAVTVNSSATEAAVRELLPQGLRVERIPMGIALPDPERLAERARPLRTRYRRGEGPLLVFAGRLVREKGVFEIVEVVAELAGEQPDLHVLLLGEGPDRPALEAYARQLGVADRITLAGWLPAAEVAAHLAAADVYLGPSHLEAQGLAMIEALAAGTPVVAARVGGIPDWVVHEETGLLVTPGAPGELAAAVRRLRWDPDLAAALARRGGERVRREASRATAAARFDALFASLLPAQSRA